MLCVKNFESFKIIPSMSGQMIVSTHRSGVREGRAGELADKTLK